MLITNTPKIHQLKNEHLVMHCTGFRQSNWSAPKAWMQDLFPPSPTATKYNEKKKDYLELRRTRYGFVAFWAVRAESRKHSR